MEIMKHIKQIEQYICDNFEKLGWDNPVEEGYLDEYEKVSGVPKDEITAFEKKYNIDLPDDFKELYKYKNGSEFFCILPVAVDDMKMSFCLMSMKEIDETKKYFQDRDTLLSDYLTPQEIEEMRDKRIKPYLFNKKWFPFAECCNCCYLMLDFDPDAAGKKGQIICYIHDPDRIFYVTSSISDLISKVIRDLYSID